MSSPLQAFMVLIISAGLMLSATGCSKRERDRHEPGVATVVPSMAATWVRNFNPLLPAVARWPTPAGIYEPLMVYNTVQGEYVPILATGYSWHDKNRKLSFAIRQGVTWSDGRPFSARDAEFTFKLLKKFPALDQSGVWEHVESVSVAGNDLIFLFKRPFVPGLYFVAQVSIVPEHIWKDVKDPVKFSNPDPVGTGPFTEVLSFKNQVYTIGANPNYWLEGKPKLKAFRVPAFPGNEQSSLALIKGQVDWAGVFIPSVERIFVSKDPEHHQIFYPKTEGTVMLYANTRRKPFSDVRVRKAISRALERERIVRIAMQGYTVPADATALSDLYKKWKDPSVFDELEDWTQFDPSRAEALLDEAGYPRGKGGVRAGNGRRLEFDVDCVSGWSDWVIAAQIIVSNLNAVGIKATLRTYEHGAWFNRLQIGEFDLAMSYSTGGPTPYTYYQRQMSRSTVVPLGEQALHNWQRYASAEADALLERLAATSDLDEQLELGNQLQRVFVKEAPAIPLFPGPNWGQANTERIVGFPSEANPYAPLAPFSQPSYLLVLRELEARK